MKIQIGFCGPVATPLEPIGVKYTIAVADDSYTVVAVDGSQIMPSHHEVHTCYLLNVGMALISYGAKLPPTFRDGAEALLQT